MSQLGQQPTNVLVLSELEAHEFPDYVDLLAADEVRDVNVLKLTRVEALKLATFLRRFANSPEPVV